MNLLHLRDAAEGTSRLEPRLLGRQPAGEAVLLRQFQVRLHLVVQLAIQAIAADQRQQAIDEAPEAHALPSSTRDTSARVCSQLATSTCSCIAPVLVSE